MTHEPAALTLSGMLCSSDTSVLDELSPQLTEWHFTDPIYRSIFRTLLAYRLVAGGVLSRSAVCQLVERSEAGTGALLLETYDALKALHTSPYDARWAVSQLRLQREDYLTTVALRDAGEIATGSVTDSDSRVWSGSGDARQWIMERVSEIEAECAVGRQPEGDVLSEHRVIVESYGSAVRESQEEDRRARFGIPTLDGVLGGIDPGELAIVAAATGVGKSALVVQLAYHAAFEQRLNVYFATSETLRRTVRNRLVARHSRSPKFAEARAEADAPLGLDSFQLSRGLLSDSHERFLKIVAADFAGECEGMLYVAQTPQKFTVPSIASQVDVLSRKTPVDLVVIDYLALLASTQRHRARNEAFAQNLWEAKTLAVDFAHGRGVGVVTPWQISRTGQEKQSRTGSVDLLDLGETTQTENTADTVIASYLDGEREADGRHQGLLFSVLKNRDGPVRKGDQAISVRADYATGLFTERATVGAVHDTWNERSVGDLL
jgi:replicative DNA helicase